MPYYRYSVYLEEAHSYYLTMFSMETNRWMDHVGPINYDLKYFWASNFGDDFGFKLERESPTIGAYVRLSFLVSFNFA